VTKKVSTAEARLLLWHPVHFVSLGFGSGLSPWAPGTAGTLVAIPLYAALSLLPLWVYIGVTLMVIVLGIYTCGRTAEALHVHDAGVIVWDEVAGFLVTMTLTPFSWQGVVAGFLLFRLFDIVKPWPIRAIDQRVPGGAGIMLDDVLAGIYSLLVLYVAASFGLF